MVDVTAKDEGSIWLFRPKTPEAETWIDENVGGESTRWAGALVVEHRFVEDLARGMKADGLSVRFE